MATSLLRTFPLPPLQVFDVAVYSAQQLGLDISIIDRNSRHLFLRAPLRRKRPQLALSVTDTGYGTAALHVSWNGSARAAGKCASRLCRHMEHTFGTARAHPAL
jgi:hypothetical protein